MMIQQISSVFVVGQLFTDWGMEMNGSAFVSVSHPRKTWKAWWEASTVCTTPQPLDTPKAVWDVYLPPSLISHTNFPTASEIGLPSPGESLWFSFP